MRCPRCAAENADGAADCAACGVVFAKLKELKDKERRAAEEALARLTADEDAGETKTDPWVWRALAIGVAVAWSSALATYYLVWSRRHAPPAAPNMPAGVPSIPR